MAAFAGFEIAIDDFGTGHSAPIYLESDLLRLSGKSIAVLSSVRRHGNRHVSSSGYRADASDA